MANVGQAFVFFLVNSVFHLGTLAMDAIFCQFPFLGFSVFLKPCTVRCLEMTCCDLVLYK